MAGKGRQPLNSRFAIPAAALLALAACQDGSEPADDGVVATQPATGTAADGSTFDAVEYYPCSFDGIAAVDGCETGIVRDWGEDGGALVEVTKPDGFTRAIFFDADGNPVGADGAEADGSAGWDFTARTEAGTHFIDYGPEHYEIAEALTMAR